MKLKEDIISNFKGKLYGAKGDTVKIISDHYNVKIVEAENGERFPVAAEMLSTEDIKPEKKIEPIVNKISKPVARIKKETPQQNTLF